MNNTLEAAFKLGYRRALEDAIFEMEIREHFHEASLLRDLMKTLVNEDDRERTHS